MMAVRCPLFGDPHGAIRVRDTRVTLDTIVTAFRAGATERRLRKSSRNFRPWPWRTPTGSSPITLNHTTEIDAHLSQREATAAALQSEIEKRFDPVGIRARLPARRNAGRANP